MHERGPGHADHPDRPGREHLSHPQRGLGAAARANVGLQSRLDGSPPSEQAPAVEQRLAATTGFGAVTGPGIRVSVDDAPDGTLVTDRDLRLLVNGLWVEAGARLHQQSAAHALGHPQLRRRHPRVNNRSLSPPYVVLASATKTSGRPDGDHHRPAVPRHGPRPWASPWSTMDNEDSLYLPAAPARVTRLRFAVEVAGQNQNRHRKGTP